MSVRLSVRSATLVLTAGALAVTGAVVAGAPASAETSSKNRTQLSTSLTGAAEVPVPGDPDGRGSGVLNVNVASGRICYSLVVSGIAPAQAAHIHEGNARTSGKVVAPLTPPTNGSSKGCVTDRKLAKEIVADPADYYLNVHNAEFGAGAIRGQLG